MNANELCKSILKLDEAIRCYGKDRFLMNNPPQFYDGRTDFLYKNPPIITDNAGYCFAENIAERGITLDIGGNLFDFIGERDINLQPLFKSYPGFSEKNGFLFITQTDVSPIFLADDGSIWGGVVGDSLCHYYGKDMVAFVDLMTECYVLKYTKYKEDTNYAETCADDDLFINEIRAIVSKTDVDPDDWIEYFYG